MNLKHPAKLLGALATAIVALAMVAPLAQAATPTPAYEQFAGCPSPEENSAATACVRSVIDGGYFQMGSKTVPIANPITLSGGREPETGNLVFSPKGGLTPVKQTVPGGVIGITGLDWLVNFLSIEQLKLYAVTELAGVPNMNLETETTSLPIKVHLINPALGNNCYVGSNTNPIKLNLITDTTSPPPPNSPITGTEPTFSFDEASEIFTFQDGAFVDNSFAAPGASGCVLTVLGIIPISLNGLVNSQAGLPSAAGKNATEQKFDLELTSQERVYLP